LIRFVVGIDIIGGLVVGIWFHGECQSCMP
jgi:hypothetical protein